MKNYNLFKKNNDFKNKSKGITLIALVVTIVVLLILSSVSINTLFGESGLITKAREATKEYSEAEKKDINELNALSDWIDMELNNSTIKEGEIAGANDKYFGVPIPQGFAVSKIKGENNINDGLVIYDLSEAQGNIDWNNIEKMQTTYNQFVWIPVKSRNEYVRNIKHNSDYKVTASNTFSDTDYLPNKTPFNINPINDSSENSEKAERDAVINANGFYIGRYEAGGTKDKATCKKDKVLVSVKPEECKKASRAMYNDEHKASALCSGIQWDMVMKTVNGKLDGLKNIFDVDQPNSARHNTSGNVYISGSNLADKVYNIYDLEDNTREYVAEQNNDIFEDGNIYPFVVRGGILTGATNASRRVTCSGGAFPDYSFRTVLYVK